jgi:hypothetical protein
MGRNLRKQRAIESSVLDGVEEMSVQVQWAAKIIFGSLEGKIRPE